MPHFSFNSRCCRYGLTVRLLVLLLLLSPFTGACNTDTASNERNDMPRERPAKEEQPDTMSIRRRHAEPTTFDLLGNPFITNRQQGKKLEAYFARINADFTVDADPIENRHRPDISDTLYTIRFGESVLELYAPTQTGDLLLQDADIRNSGIMLRNNMKVGMSQPELMNKLKGHDVRILQTNNEIVATTNEGAPIALRFFLKNGKVNRIKYEGYVD